jgi:SWI/SNF-related matrix-associated actin-dependent regulator of chromatin subfamily D
LQDLSASLEVFEESIPSWTLRIQGKMIDPPNAKKIPGHPPKFSNFIKKIIIELKRDEEIYPEGNTIEWEKRPGDPETDGFEVKRQGDSDTQVKILVYLDRHPEKFKLSPALGHLLDIQMDTMSNVLLAIWQYVKVNKLLDPEDPRCIKCDEALTSVYFLKLIK